MLEVLDVVGVVLAADQIVDSLALLVDWKSGLVEFVNRIVLFVVYYRMQDALIGESVQTLLLVTFEKLFLRGCQVYFALELVFFLVVLGGGLLLLGFMAGKS